MTHNTNHTSGIITLELLLALGIMVTILSAAVVVSFGGQSSGLDTNLTYHGLHKISSSFEDSVAAAFSGWNTLADETVTDGIYTKNRTVNDVSPCLKYVAHDIDWTTEKSRGQHIGYQTHVANVEVAQALGGGCDPFPPASDWDTPEAYDFPNSIIHSGSQGTGVDVLTTASGKRLAFLTTIKRPGKDTLWIIDVTDPSDPSSISLESSYSNGKEHYNAVDVITDGYAFVGAGTSTAQLQVFDVSTPSAPSLVASEALPDIDFTCPASPSPTSPYPDCSTHARSIYYYNEHVYVGTGYMISADPNENHELHVYDVSNPTNPTWEYSINVDRNVNDIIIRDEHAFLATGPGTSFPYTPFKIFDLADPSHPEIGSFGIPTPQQGTAVYVLGNTAYLGLKRGTVGDDFYILDISDPATPAEVNTKHLGGSNTKIGDIHVQGSFAFIGVNDSNPVHSAFQVWDVSDPSSLSKINCSGDPFPQNLTEFAYADNLIFTAFRSNDALRVIYDTADSCTP